MREILFRGKGTSGYAAGKWIYGYYVKDFWGQMRRGHGIIPTDEERGGYCEVDPETVGQYTGLTDKNGRKIFEGDVLKIAKLSDSTGIYYFPPLNYPVNVVVKWDMCSWMWETLCEDKRYIGFPEAWCHYVCEIIGNIHDNPELLDRGK